MMARLRLVLAILAICGLSGCSVVTVHAKVDPAGGALTESFACLYDFDARGFWYVLFVHEDGLLGAVHRHNPGIHLFVNDRVDLLFVCRCSGRGEVLDIMDQTYWLKNGGIFFCDVANSSARVRQLPINPPMCDGRDPEAIAKALYTLSLDPRVAANLPEEVRQRLAAQWRVEASKKKSAPSNAAR